MDRSSTLQKASHNGRNTAVVATPAFVHDPELLEHLKSVKYLGFYLFEPMLI